MLDSSQAWSAKNNDADQWYEIDLGDARLIKGVVIRARGSSCQDQFVKSFQLQIDSKDVDEGKVFDGFDAQPCDDARKRILLSEPVLGQKLRFHPVTWNNHISLRLGLLLQEC